MTGYGPNDGQLLNRATYPDVWAMIAAGTVPVVSDAVWLADPTKRGCYSTGDGATTFRLPDYNGHYAGSLGAVFLRGDGTMSAAVAGAIQPDAMQGHHHQVTGGNGAIYTAGSTRHPNVEGTVDTAWKATTLLSDGINGNPRSSNETRPLNVTGCWIVKLFGSVINPGAVDAAQLASDLVALTARVSTLESNQRITKEFVSTPQPITSGGGLVIGHGLGSRAKFVTAELVCISADAGWGVGEVIPVAVTQQSTDAHINSGMSVGLEAANLVIRFGSNPAVFLIANKATGIGVTAINTKWNLVVRAFA